MLPRDPILVLFGVHSAALDDTHTNVNDIAIPHGVSCGSCVRCANEEARREGLDTFGRMPLGGHSLSVRFAVFACGLSVSFDEPIEHVQEDHVGVFHTNWFVRFVNRLWEIRQEDIREGRIHGNNIDSCFLVAGMGSFQALTLVVRSASSEVWDGVNFGWKRKIICRVGFVREKRIETW